MDVEGDRWIRVAKAGGDHVDRNAGQEKRGRVDVPEVVKAGVGRRLIWGLTAAGPRSGRGRGSRVPFFLETDVRTNGPLRVLDGMDRAHEDLSA